MGPGHGYSVALRPAALFTDCPGCQRQFRLTARHLSAAGGEVRCGFCGMRFNALGRLRDAPLEAPPEPDLPELDESIGDAITADAPMPVQPEQEPEPEPEPEFDIAMEPSAPVAPAGLAWTPGAAAAARRESMVVEDVEDARPRRGPGWAALVLVLLLVGALQGAWFERDRLLARYPQLRPHVEQWCAQAGCSVLRRHDLSAITVLNRDVRQHPRYEDTLLVNATIQNGADSAQPYPRIELALSDTNGRVIAARAFRADEYLDASMDVGRGMEPGVPVHVVLEIAGAGPAAASFEIGFR